MDKAKLWETHYDNNRCPCFITDRTTVEILYCNPAFLQLFNKDKSMIGSNFYDIVSLSDTHLEDSLPDWKNQDYYETETYNETLNMRFLLKATYDKVDDTIFCTLIPTELDLEANYEFEKAMTRCVEIFDNKKANSHTMEDFSLLLADFYDSEVAYVYHFDQKNKKVVCVAHYTSQDYQQNGGSTSSMGMDSIIRWFQDDTTPTIIIADIEHKKTAIHPVLQDIIETFQVRNVVFHKVEDGKGNFVGMVGVTNRRDTSKLFDRRLISTVARFVAQDVVNGLSNATEQQQENRDTLTGLFNRDGYSLILKQVWADKPKTLGVISANVNGLKVINENLGIHGGDEAIKSSAKYLTEHFGYLFFRMSGDEFLGIAPNIDSHSFNEQVVELYKKMKQEENYDFSFGHAFGSGNIDLTKLTLEADTVMYINKQEYYSSTQRSFDNLRDSMLAQLLSYLADDEFMVYLQPQVRLEDGSIYGAEALIRRFDKVNQKMVFPDQFIPLYEQKSIIRHVDMFVVETVCKLIETWSKKHKTFPISVNLSRVTLLEYGIVDNIVAICDKYNVPHHLLVIEVTERVGLVENNVASELIRNFKDHGFHISLDDFGCAYSNIVTLAQIDVDEVKIDKSLVDDLTTNKKNRILVKNVLSMCNELENTATLAEGIEEEEQAKQLHQLGCQLGQGYFYSRPIPVADFEEQYLK